MMYFDKLHRTKVLFLNQYKNQISLICYCLVAYLTWNYSKEISLGGQFFKTGDYLINYEGGFIRRGLLGQILYYLSSRGISLLWSTFTLQVFIYVLSTFLILRIFFSQKRNLFWLLILFSPAFFFLFPFYDFGGGFRKEALVFLSFTLLASNFKDGFDSKIQYFWMSSSIFIFLLAALEHEVAVFCLPFFIFLLLQLGEKWGSIAVPQLVIAAFLYCLISALAISIAIIFPGSPDTPKLICDSLLRAGLEPFMCDGAIAWTNVHPGVYHQQVLDLIHSNRYLLIYTFLLMLSLYPIFLTSWLKTRWALFLVSFLIFLPLYYLTADWGRWLATYMFMIYITLMVEPISLSTRKIPFILILLYCSVWSIPHFGGKQVGSGLLSLYQRHTNPLQGSPFNSNLWTPLSNYYSNIYIPPYYQEQNRPWVAYLADNFALKSNARNASNADISPIEKKLNNQFIKSVENGNFASDTIYIIPDEIALSINQSLDLKTDFFGRIDGLNVLAPGWKKCKSCTQYSRDYDIAQLIKPILPGETIDFSKSGFGSQFLIGVGSAWGNPEIWGTWSTAKSAKIALPLNSVKKIFEDNPRPLTLSLKVRAFTAPSQPFQEVDIWMDGIYKTRVIIRNGGEKLITLPIPAESVLKKNVVIKLDLPNRLRPKDIGIGDDTRELGVGLISGQFD